MAAIGMPNRGLVKRRINYDELLEHDFIVPGGGALPNDIDDPSISATRTLLRIPVHCNAIVLKVYMKAGEYVDVDLVLYE